MEIKLTHNGKEYIADLHEPLDISIPLEHDNTPIAFGAPAYHATPLKAGSFIGSLEEGSSVNFYNLKINPHGNGTHTESVRHIDLRGKSILETLQKQHHIAKLITVKPLQKANKDLVVTRSLLDVKKQDLQNISALVIRTKPNRKTKKTKNYTNTNPIYFDPKLLSFLSQHIDHLLIDVPSVDREQDGGRLKGHKAFWQTNDDIALDKTITEMVYVDNKIKDGLYLLNIQIIPVVIDASPSRPVLYVLREAKCLQSQ